MIYIAMCISMEYIMLIGPVDIDLNYLSYREKTKQAALAKNSAAGMTT